MALLLSHLPQRVGAHIDLIPVRIDPHQRTATFRHRKSIWIGPQYRQDTTASGYGSQIDYALKSILERQLQTMAG